MKVGFEIILVLLIYMSTTLGRKYRCDYSYFADAEGWLKVNPIPANWFEARLRCHLEGGKLASPLTTGLSESMMKYIDGEVDRRWGVYTGIHATFSKGDYFSVEGVPLSRMVIKWADNEPDNFNDKESCIVMLHDGTLADVNCNDTFPYICYWKSDEDFSLNECGTVDDEYKLDTRTGKCYKFHKIPRTWSRAYMACAAEGAHLVIVNSVTEAKVVRELFAKYPGNSMVGNFWKDVAFVGFHDWGEHGEWITIDGTPLAQAGYSQFSGGEPNNATTGEFCGAIYRNGMFDDLWCENKHAFICEKSPDSLKCFKEP
ncbi:uncharacterized protein [Epargyreus clarus]|uniref:uncharacterized protein n=1 Tax=Epargyreus clarus TaxID=520877 RepID=UPI003C2CA804